MGASGYGPWDNDVGEEYLWDTVLNPLDRAFYKALNPGERDNPRGNLDKARSAAAVLVLVVRGRPGLLDTKAGAGVLASAVCALNYALASRDYVDNYREPERAREKISEEIAALKGLR